jgi:glycerol-3-phosphate acyltransferase PlsY
MSAPLLCLLFYLAGSIPFGVIFSRLGGKDIQSLGSGNTGAANVYRNLGFIYGLATFLTDFSKSYFPLSLYNLYHPHDRLIYCLALCCFLGHCFSVFLAFRGGKGVSVSMGILAFFSWYYALIFVVAYVFFLIILKISSLASLGSFLISTACIYFLPVKSDDKTLNIFIFSVILFILLLFMHGKNIRRLINRNELQI